MTTGDIHVLVLSGKSLLVNLLNPPPPQNNVAIVGLLWMNQDQNCVGGGEGKGDRKIICWQKC